jgi:molybdate transport system ATP-binding protein
MGYVFQEARLFPHLSVRQNLLYGRRFAPEGPEAVTRPEEFDRIVDLLGIGPLLDRRPRDLSGGETQRVAIGRALLSRPAMLLADEPLAALDAERKEEILPYFEGCGTILKVPILYVSHAASEVARLATTVVVLQDGRVLRSGPAAEVLGDPDVAPLGPRDAGALLEARVVRHHEDGLTELDAGGHALFLPRLGHAPGRTVRVRIAAQDVILSRDRGPRGCRRSTSCRAGSSGCGEGMVPARWWRWTPARGAFWRGHPPLGHRAGPCAGGGGLRDRQDGVGGARRCGGASG